MIRLGFAAAVVCALVGSRVPLARAQDEAGVEAVGAGAPAAVAEGEGRPVETGSLADWRAVPRRIEELAGEIEGRAQRAETRARAADLWLRLGDRMAADADWDAALAELKGEGVEPVAAAYALTRIGEARLKAGERSAGLRALEMALDRAVADLRAHPTTVEALSERAATFGSGDLDVDLDRAREELRKSGKVGRVAAILRALRRAGAEPKVAEAAWAAAAADPSGAIYHSRLAAMMLSPDELFRALEGTPVGAGGVEAATRADLIEGLGDTAPVAEVQGVEAATRADLIEGLIEAARSDPGPGAIAIFDRVSPLIYGVVGRDRRPGLMHDLADAEAACGRPMKALDVFRTIPEPGTPGIAGISRTSWEILGSTVAAALGRAGHFEEARSLLDRIEAQVDPSDFRLIPYIGTFPTRAEVFGLHDALERLALVPSESRGLILMRIAWLPDRATNPAWSRSVYGWLRVDAESRLAGGGDPEAQAVAQLDHIQALAGLGDLEGARRELAALEVVDDRPENRQRQLAEYSVSIEAIRRGDIQEFFAGVDRMSAITARMMAEASPPVKFEKSETLQYRATLLHSLARDVIPDIRAEENRP